MQPAITVTGLAKQWKAGDGKTAGLRGVSPQAGRGRGAMPERELFAQRRPW
jgi:hypothetical protein